MNMKRILKFINVKRMRQWDNESETKNIANTNQKKMWNTCESRMPIS